ncbi:MAG: hypothetical protein EOO73_31820 [Myxococcales bacterium]|nr:MAG: hypothetical protein EOO73_31820 [Myxococcales bacterium]
MTAQGIHRLDVFVAFLTIVSWASLMILLEKVTDRRMRLVKLASLGPLHHSYVRLPAAWGPLHGVLITATLLWLAAVLVPPGKLRPWLFVTAAGCLVFLATAWALSPETAPG